VPKPEFDILGFGTIAVDDTLYVEHYPPPDQKARIRRESRSLGGQVATALAAASRAGARCAYAALLGDDELSNAARKGLIEGGVDCRFIRPKAGSGPVHSVIVIDESTKTRNIFFDLSRMTKLPADDVGEDLVCSAKVLLVDQLGPEAVIRAGLCAKRHGVQVVMDLEWPDSPCIDEMMAVADHLLVPHDFAAAHTGLADPGDIARELHRRHPRACTAVTCGTNGCYFLAAGDVSEVRHMPAFVIETLETTGCGDVFHGGYAVALAAGEPVVECLRFASATAAAFAARPSGWQHLPALCDVNSLLSNSLNLEKS
jgi:sulfofructose kinase